MLIGQKCSFDKTGLDFDKTASVSNVSNIASSSKTVFVPRIKKQEPKKGKSGSKPSKPHHVPRQKQQYPQRVAPSCRHCGKTGHTKADYFKLKPRKPKDNQLYEWLVSMIKIVLTRLDKLDNAHNPALKVKKIWVRNDDIIHPLRGSRLT